MAIYGFYDADMTKYFPIPFNLELMKMATYYKDRRHIVTHVTKLEPDYFTKIFFRKDYNDGNFPPILHSAQNIEWGGHAFSGPRYAPMDEKIERSLPDVHLYQRFTYPPGGQDPMRTVQRYRKIQHMRLSLDGVNVWNYHDEPIDLVSTRRNIIFHDYNLGAIEGAHEAIARLLKQEWKIPIKIGTKFPIMLYEAQEIYDWLLFPWIPNEFKIIFYGFLEDEDFVRIIDRINYNGSAAQFEYVVTGNCEGPEVFFKERLERLLAQLIYAKNRKVKVNVSTDQYFFSDKRWDILLSYLGKFSGSGTLSGKRKDALDKIERNISTDNFARYIDRLNPYQLNKLKTTRNELADMMDFIRIDNYKFFDLLYQMSEVELRGGKLIDATK